MSKMSIKLYFLCFICVVCTEVTGQQADTVKLYEHLVAITKNEKPRNYENRERLNEVAQYIYTVFEQYADSTYYQEFEVKAKGMHTYKNVVAVFGSNNEETIVVGAHYDVCMGTEGADDNASGIVGLLELARMLDGKALNYRIEMVAYTLEEPPFFRSNYMGSAQHAAALIENKVPVYGMICLEMIGYFDDAKKSQDYPISALSLIYGNKGNYITLVNKMNKGRFSRKFNRLFKGEKLIRTKKFTAPKGLPGIDYSDHLNYWKHGIPAVMITDTAFYRNKNYHKTTDTLETLDLARMALVIDSVYKALLGMK